MPQPRQPFLHDLVVVPAAPTQVLSASDGTIVATADQPSAQGVLHADVRALSAVAVRVGGLVPEHIATALEGPTATFTSVVRGLPGMASDAADPQLRVDWRRTVSPGTVRESVTLSSVHPSEIATTVELAFASDLAAMELVKVGAAAEPVILPEPADGSITWSNSEIAVRITAGDAELRSSGPSAEARWSVTVPSRGQVEVGWTVELVDPAGPIVAAGGAGLDAEALTEQVMADLTAAGRSEHRLRPWLRRSLDDLNGLRMATRARPDDTFFAAGAPWYLTLFGRDSLWAARLLLPLDRSIAEGTLRTLAGLVGTRDDPETGEAPGKIMHELRRGQYAFGGISLPPLYYGTIDATPLWVCLLHDAWRAGMPEEQVNDLVPTLEACLGWITGPADADGDGFCEYIDRSGHGLANQGWKDSADSVRFADGSWAEGPVALCEVQGYAYEAAVAGAELLDAFGRHGGETYRRWAAQLATRFREQFWCGEGDQRFPALALDGRKRRVDSLTSNIGHLLGTGLLDPGEELVVARLVADPRLDCGLGLRTMSDADGGYSPLSYHCGSVWPHDTAVVIRGLQRAGLIEHGAGLVEGLLRASVAFDARLPELWSGEGRAVPYPASCRPQAWSAAAAVTVASVLVDRA